jgi:transcriptional regulator with XRE-family HTH domain
MRVREVAEAHGIKNASQLSRRTGIAQTPAYNLWDGTATNPHILTLVLIARALGVPVTDLYEETGEESPGNHKARMLLAV